MNNYLRRMLCGLTLLLGINGTVQAGELLVGGGYGEQVGLKAVKQDNAVVDILYDVGGIDLENFRLSAGCGVSWMWNDYDDDDVLIGSLFPQLRYFFYKNGTFSPYAFAITGFSYINEPRLGHQLLGGNFTFNDFFGAGAYMGRKQVWSINFCWRHISNAGIFSPNRGIDVPFCMLIGRKF